MAFGSSIGSAGDAVYVPILPSFNNFFDEMGKKAEKSGKETGEKIARSIEAGVEKAQKAVDRSAEAQQRAWNRVADAAGKTSVAQAKLAEVQEKAGAKQSDILRATEAYEKAKRDEEAALRKAETATQAHEKAQQDLKVKTEEAANATKVGAEATDEYGRAVAGADDSSKGFEISLKSVAVAAAAIGAACLLYTSDAADE